MASAQAPSGRSNPRLLAAAIVIAAIVISGTIAMVSPSMKATTTTTVIQTSTETTTLTSTLLRGGAVGPFIFLTASSMCTATGGYSPCWGTGDAYVFNCTTTQSLLAGPPTPQQCTQQVTSTMAPHPSYNITISIPPAGQGGEPLWANCQWGVAGIMPGTGYGYCIELNSTSNAVSFIMGEPAPPPPVMGTASTIQGSAQGLQLSLSVTAAGNGTYRIVAQESNLLSSPNNVEVGNRWPYPAIYLDPFDGCGAYSYSPVGFAVFQGSYDLNNFTDGRALALFNTTYPSTCTTNSYPVAYFQFAPASDVASIVDSQGTLIGNQSISDSLLAAGYWTGGPGMWGGSKSPATLHTFMGTYTVVAADEWGAVAIAHFAAS